MTTPDSLPLARRMWRTLEPFHGLVYFAPEVEAEYAALGSRGRTGYFASRSAPMGAVPAAIVTATFFNFSPELVERAMAGAWTHASPADWCAARRRGIDAALRRALSDEVVEHDDMVRAAAAAREAALAVGPFLSGRPLAAGHAVLPWPAAPHLVLWHAISILREFRGDGHVALLTAAGLSGIEALVTHAASGGVPAAVLQATRGWRDDEWARAVAGLHARGVIDAAGAFMPEGSSARDAIEAQTDVLAAAPWDVLGDDRGQELRALVRPWSARIVAGGDFGRLPDS